MIFMSNLYLTDYIFSVPMYIALSLLKFNCKNSSVFDDVSNL